MDEKTDKEIPWSSWFEIPVSDMDRAQKFYETVFEISIHVMIQGPDFKMGVFPHNEVGAALCWGPKYYKPSADGVNVYINARPDLQAYLDRVKLAGGKVLTKKKQISPDHGYMATFLDTEGNRLSMHSFE